MEPWQHQFQNALADGDLFLSEQDYGEALGCFKKAFRLIPQPRDELEESTIAVTAIGDCYIASGDIDAAEQAFRDVLLLPGAPANPYVRLRRGEIYRRLGDLKKARMELTTAYMNGGEEVLKKSSDPEIQRLLREVIDELSSMKGR
jgi:tetratricopeptide (TPR) repeat protein